MSSVMEPTPDPIIFGGKAMIMCRDLSISKGLPINLGPNLTSYVVGQLSPRELVEGAIGVLRERYGTLQLAEGQLIKASIAPSPTGETITETGTTLIRFVGRLVAASARSSAVQLSKQGFGRGATYWSYPPEPPVMLRLEAIGLGEDVGLGVTLNKQFNAHASGVFHVDKYPSLRKQMPELSIQVDEVGLGSIRAKRVSLWVKVPAISLFAFSAIQGTASAPAAYEVIQRHFMPFVADAWELGTDVGKFAFDEWTLAHLVTTHDQSPTKEEFTKAVLSRIRKKPRRGLLGGLTTKYEMDDF